MMQSLYAAIAVGGLALMADTALRTTNQAATKSKKLKLFKATQEKGKLLTPYERFKRIKKEYVKESENFGPRTAFLAGELYLAEQELQDPKLGFYFGDAIELGQETSKMKREPLYLPWSHLDNHYAFFGTTRFGKSRAMANHIRQFVNKGYNVFVIDPKGGEKHDVLSWTIEAASDAGRLSEFQYYNPVYPSLSDCFNPLFGKSNNQISDEILFYAKAKTGLGSDDFFTEQVGKISVAITTGLDYLEKNHDPYGQNTQIKLQEEIKNYRINRLTNGHKVSFDKETMTMKPDLSYRADKRISETIGEIDPHEYRRTFITFKDLAYYSLYDNLLSLKTVIESTPVTPLEDDPSKYNELRHLRDEALSLLEAACGASKDNYDKTTGTLTRILTKLSTGAIGRIFCTTLINPILLGISDPNGGIISVIQPSPLTYQNVSQTIMKVFLKTFESIYGSVADSGRPLPRRSVLIIDEAAKALFPGIEELINKLGGLGMTLGLYTQSQADFDMQLGKDVANVVLDNINTMAYMKTNDGTSKSRASENFGQLKVIDYAMQVSGGVGAMGRVGITSDLIDIAHPDSFDSLNKGEALVSHYGKKYLVQLPYQPSPNGYLIMPQLEIEKTIAEMIKFDELLKKELAESVA